MAQATSDHRRATAERNADAILDATERLLERHTQVTVSAVAAEAGLSRVTFYAHFKTVDEVLESVVARAVRQATEALDAADLDSGPPSEALERLVTVSWREMERHQSTARAAAERLSPKALHDSHRPARKSLRRLAERGRADGSFRTDLPADWLITGCLALMHAATDEVRAGRMSATAGRRALVASVRDLWTPA